MYDQCNECTSKGDLGKCESTPCSKHESWYAKTLKETITKLQQPAKKAGEPHVSITI